MKRFILAVSILLICTTCYAADQVISITIPSDKVAIALEGFLTIYPNTELNDPKDPESGLKYTNAQWVKEQIRRILVRDVRRGLQMKADIENQIAEDNLIAQ